MPPADRTRQLATLEKAAGPSPWYWKSFPAITGNSRQRFTWTYHGDTGSLAYLTTLALESEPERPRLALNTYSVPFEIGPNHLGVWCPEPGSVRVLCFDPDQLAVFQFEEIVGWFKQSNERIFSATPPIAEFEVSRRAAAGTHNIEVPVEFRMLDELIAVTSYPALTKDDPASAVFVMYPQAGLVEVIPQKWFAASKVEAGYQWISRIARDPGTHRLIGECVRLGKFVLTPDSTDVEEWIEKT